MMRHVGELSRSRYAVKTAILLLKKSNTLMQSKVKNSKLNTADLKEKAKQQLLF